MVLHLQTHTKTNIALALGRITADACHHDRGRIPNQPLHLTAHEDSIPDVLWWFGMLAGIELLSVRASRLSMLLEGKYLRYAFVR